MTIHIPDFDSIHHLIADQVPSLDLPKPKEERSPVAAVAGIAPVVIPDLVYTPRPVKGFRYLAEWRRIELLLLPRMAYETIYKGASTRNHYDYHYAQGLWTDAIAECIAGLTAKEVRKLGGRMNRESDKLYHEHKGGFFPREWDLDKVAMVLFFTACDLTSDGTLELYEGSAAAEGLLRMWRMVEDKAAREPDLVRSAEKQSGKFREFLASKGYFK